MRTKLLGYPVAKRNLETHSLFAHRYLNGEAPGWVYYILQLSTIVPVLKGDTPAKGIRPISVFSTLAKAWKAEYARDLRGPISDSAVLMPTQLGVGAPNGGGTIALATDIFMETLGAQNGQAVIACDIKNAFSETKRKAIIEALLECPIKEVQKIVNCVHKSLSISSKATNFDVMIEEGGPQGCPWMPHLFALVYQKVLLQAQRDVGLRASVMAYLDDTTFMGDLKASLEAMRKLAINAKDTIDLQFNPSKTLVMARNCDDARATINEMAAQDPWFRDVKIGCIPGADPATIQWGQGVGVMINGSPRGDIVYKHYHLDRIEATAGATAERTVDLIGASNPQGAYGLLRYSAQTLLNHIAQANHPSLTKPYLKRYQKRVDSLLTRFTGLDFCRLRTEGDNMQTLTGLRIGLKTSQGGLGFRSLSSSAEAAYLGGFIMAAPRMSRRKATVDMDRSSFWNFPHLPPNSTAIPGCCEILHPYLNPNPDLDLFYVSTTGRVRRERFKRLFSTNNLQRSATIAAVY
ncbi:hypothetical protein TrCOL_g13096, partial [Triparma columacea]